MRSSEKFAQPRVMLDLMSAGASLATFTEPCMRDSGMFFIEGIGGGSTEMKQRRVFAFSQIGTEFLYKIYF